MVLSIKAKEVGNFGFVHDAVDTITTVGQAIAVALLTADQVLYWLKLEVFLGVVDTSTHIIERKGIEGGLIAPRRGWHCYLDRDEALCLVNYEVSLSVVCRLLYGSPDCDDVVASIIVVVALDNQL